MNTVYTRNEDYSSFSYTFVVVLFLIERPKPSSNLLCGCNNFRPVKLVTIVANDCRAPKSYNVTVDNYFKSSE